MSNPNQDGKAPKISEDVLQRIASTLKPVRNDQLLYRRNQRPPLLSLNNPARGRFTAHAIQFIGDLATYWGLDSRYPQALRAHESNVPGFLLLEPVAVYDSTDKNQYPITWLEGFRQASINLRPLLQPRNLEAPEGYVREFPVSLHQLPGSDSKHYLFLHTNDSKVRPEGEITPEEEDFTAADGDGAGPSPKGQVAPGEQE